MAPGTGLTVAVISDRIELTPEAAPAPALTRKSCRLVLAAGSEPLDAAAAIRSERQAQSRRGRRA
jgi:hypothetical protein